MYLEASRVERVNRRRVQPRLDVGELGLIGEEPDGEDLIAEWLGRSFVCPRNTRIRMLEGALAFYNAYSVAGASLIVPETVAERAARELVRLSKIDPLSRSHILTSAWFVPLRWFVPFDPSEREVIGQPEVAGIRYRTLAGRAKQRLRRALDALRSAGLDESVIQQLDDLDEWVGGFHRSSMLELDYGTVAQLFHPSDLVIDETADDVWMSISALERGDLNRAGEHYAAAASRWAPAMAVTYSN